MRGYGELNPNSKGHQSPWISSYIWTDGTARRGPSTPALSTECRSCPLTVETANTQGASLPLSIFVLQVQNPHSLWLQEETVWGPLQERGGCGLTVPGSGSASKVKVPVPVQKASGLWYPKQAALNPIPAPPDVQSPRHEAFRGRWGCLPGGQPPGQMPPPGSAPGFGLGMKKGKRKQHPASGGTGEAGGEESRG